MLKVVKEKYKPEPPKHGFAVNLELTPNA